MTAIEFLVDVRDLLSVPAHWTQGCAARNHAGQPCDASGDDAERFSLLGALDRVAVRRDGGTQACQAIGMVLAKRLGYALPPSERGCGAAIDLLNAFNEIANHIAVVSVLEQAIQEARRDQSERPH